MKNDEKALLCLRATGLTRCRAAVLGRLSEDTIPLARKPVEEKSSQKFCSHTQAGSGSAEASLTVISGFSTEVSPVSRFLEGAEQLESRT